MGQKGIQALGRLHCFEGNILHIELCGTYLYLELNYMVHTGKTKLVSQITCSFHVIFLINMHSRGKTFRITEWETLK